MRRIAFLIIIIALAPGCAKRARVAAPTGAASTTATGGADGVVRAPAADDEADGQASWYGDPYHGRRTASGEVYDKNKLTAAHRTLPFDTWVRVENRLNGRTVDVRINDRGPFVAGRVIDLSEEAARKIDMIRSGVAPVRLKIVRESKRATATASDAFYVVQLGAFKEEKIAQNLRRKFEKKYTGIYVDRPTPDSPYYKVRIGRSLLREARHLQQMIREEDKVEAIVLQVRTSDL